MPLRTHRRRNYWLRRINFIQILLLTFTIVISAITVTSTYKVDAATYTSTTIVTEYYTTILTYNTTSIYFWTNTTYKIYNRTYTETSTVTKTILTPKMVIQAVTSIIEEPDDYYTETIIYYVTKTVMVPVTVKSGIVRTHTSTISEDTTITYSTTVTETRYSTLNKSRTHTMELILVEPETEEDSGWIWATPLIGIIATTAIIFVVKRMRPALKMKEPRNIKYCISCGKPIPEDTLYCRYCGAKQA